MAMAVHTPSYENHDIMSQLDLHSSDGFRVTFDMFTPRAHLMIVPRDRASFQRESPGSFFDLDEDRQLQVIRLATYVQEEFQLSLAILSLHRGTWLRCRSLFTTHIATEPEEYLHLFDSIKGLRPMSVWWPSAGRDVITNQWTLRDPKSYQDNVLLYPTRSYQHDDITSIMVHIAASTLPGTECSHSSGYDNTEDVVFHTSKKRIGIEAGSVSEPEHILCLINRLDVLARTVGADGYHICIDLKDKGFSGFRTSPAAKVLGYIEVPGETYYKHCPDQYRAEWFNQYKASNDRVFT